MLSRSKYWKATFLLVSFLYGFLLVHIPLNAQIIIDSPITPNDEFFTTAIDFFDLNSETYLLKVAGNIYNPLSLNLSEIKAFPVTSEIVRLTCVAYEAGATSYTGVANWTGVQLSEILNLAQIKTETAFDVIFRTPDHSPEGYSTSLTIEQAFWKDVILAYEMNGVPLPPDHGYPLRLVCPRFYGYKWIKWLTDIEVTSLDYQGYWERTGRYSDSPFVGVALPIYYNYTIKIDPNSQSSIIEYYTASASFLGETSTSGTSWISLELAIITLFIASRILKLRSKRITVEIK
jgi:hypothetical protein